MYNIKDKQIRTRIEISSSNAISGKTERFYMADFVKPDISLFDGILFFSKYLLQEFYYLNKIDDKKDIWYVIKYYDDNVLKVIKDSNLWLDQLESLLELNGSKIMYKKMEAK